MKHNVEPLEPSYSNFYKSLDSLNDLFSTKKTEERIRLINQQFIKFVISTSNLDDTFKDAIYMYYREYAIFINDYYEMLDKMRDDNIYTFLTDANKKILSGAIGMVRPYVEHPNILCHYVSKLIDEKNKGCWCCGKEGAPYSAEGEIRTEWRKDSALIKKKLHYERVENVRICPECKKREEAKQKLNTWGILVTFPLYALLVLFIWFIDEQLWSQTVLLVLLFLGFFGAAILNCFIVKKIALYKDYEKYKTIIHDLEDHPVYSYQAEANFIPCAYQPQPIKFIFNSH